MVFSHWIGLVLFLISTLSSPVHEFYVSICYIQITPDNQIEIKQRIFRNDLELGVARDISEDRWVFQDDSASINQVMDYVIDHLSLEIDDVEVPLQAQIIEAEGEGPTETINILLAGKLSKGFENHVTIESSILLDIYDDQVNMVHVRFSDFKRKSKNLDHTEPSFTVKKEELQP